MGCIAGQEPCTAYRVHKEFSNSPSLYFSGSAGAVYPAFRRLEARGLIKAKSVGTRLRPAKGYVLTKAGREVFQAWYLAPALAADGGFDPLRLRFSILKSQKPEERSLFSEAMIQAAAARLERMTEVISRVSTSSPDYFASLMERATLEAKLKLLRDWKKAGVTFLDF